MKTRSASIATPFGVGVITIFMVLIVLCLSILATLTLSTAQADLRLSQVNADTTTAYYTADAYAAELYAQFCAGDQPELTATIPMTINQSLFVHFGRDDGGNPTVLVWQTVSTIDQGVWEDDLLPVWQG